MKDNRYFIIRTDRAGVFFAQIAERRGSETDLLNARRIHYWQQATECIGIATSGVGGASRLTGRIHATIHGRAAWYSQATVFAARGIIGKTDPDRLPMSPFAAMLMDIAINTIAEARA